MVETVKKCRRLNKKSLFCQKLSSMRQGESSCPIFEVKSLLC